MKFQRIKEKDIQIVSRINKGEFESQEKQIAELQIKKKEKKNNSRKFLLNIIYLS